MYIATSQWSQFEHTVISMGIANFKAELTSIQLSKSKAY